MSRRLFQPRLEGVINLLLEANMSRPRTSLSQRAEAIIRKRIICGDFAFGERLSDRTLAETVGISRTPIREALARLAGQDLVSIRPQSGTFVMHPSAESIRTVCDVRAVLECGALKIVVVQGPASAIEPVRAAVDEGERAVRKGDLAAASRMDKAFHEALVAASGNPLLVRAYRGIADQVEAIRQRLPPDAARMRTAVEQHRHILDLLAAGDVPLAENELSAHVRRVQHLATHLFAAPGPGAPAHARRPSPK